MHNDQFYDGIGEEIAIELLGTREAKLSKSELAELEKSNSAGQEEREARNARIAQLQGLIPKAKNRLEVLKQEQAKEMDEAAKAKRQQEIDRIENAITVSSAELADKLAAAEADAAKEAAKASSSDNAESKPEKPSKKEKKEKSKKKDESESTPADSPAPTEPDEAAEGDYQEPDGYFFNDLEKVMSKYVRRPGETDEEYAARIISNDDSSNDAHDGDTTGTGNTEGGTDDNADGASDKGTPEPDSPTATDPIPVQERSNIAAIVRTNNTVKPVEDMEDEQMSMSGNMVDMVKALKNDEIAVAIAQAKATNGKVLTPDLQELILQAIENNVEVREYIAASVAVDCIYEFPELLADYRKAVNEVSRDHRMRYMTFCPRNGKMYEDVESAYADLDKDDLIALTKGEWAFEDGWIKVDENGDTVEVLQKQQVINRIKALPEEIQADAASELHVELPKKSNAKGKPDKGNSKA